MMSLSPPLTAEQRGFLHKAFSEMTSWFPKLSPLQLVEGPLATFVLGPVPRFSNLKTHKLTNVTTAAAGSFIIAHAHHPTNGEPVFLVIKRGDKGPLHEDRWGVPGGFTNLDFTKASTFITRRTNGEQPADGAVRELREEILNADGKAILDIDPKRLSLLKTGIDYRQAASGGLPTFYNGFSLNLTSDEYKALNEHVLRLKTDPNYKQAVTDQSRGEVQDVMLITLSDISLMHESQFTHPHEYEALKQAAFALAPTPPSKIPPFLFRRTKMGCALA